MHGHIGDDAAAVFVGRHARHADRSAIEQPPQFVARGNSEAALGITARPQLRRIEIADPVLGSKLTQSQSL